MKKRWKLENVRYFRINNRYESYRGNQNNIPLIFQENKIQHGTDYFFLSQFTYGLVPRKG